jgi:hypothetical protein
MLSIQNKDKYLLQKILHNIHTYYYINIQISKQILKLFCNFR